MESNIHSIVSREVQLEGVSISQRKGRGDTQPAKLPHVHVQIRQVFTLVSYYIAIDSTYV